MATLELKEIVDNSNHYETDTKKIYSLKTDDKEYKIEIANYFDETSGNQSTLKKIFDKNNDKELYSYFGVTAMETDGKKVTQKYEETCEQDIFEISDEFLKKIEDINFPTEKEILASNIKKTIANNYYTQDYIQSKIDSYFDNFKEVFRDIVEKKHLEDKLQNFIIYSNEGMEFDSTNPNSNISDYLKNSIIDFEDEEYLDNMNLKDIEEWDILKENGLVNIVYKTKDYLGRDTTEEYIDYDDYVNKVVKEELSKELVEKYDKGELESFEKELKNLVLENRGIFSKEIKKSEIEEKELISEKTSEKEF